MLWLLFAVSAAVIVIAGAKLSRYGDQIAELTGLGLLWIGVVLMGAGADGNYLSRRKAVYADRTGQSADDRGVRTGAMASVQIEERFLLATVLNEVSRLARGWMSPYHGGANDCRPIGE